MNPLTMPPPISRRFILQQERGQAFDSPPTACQLTVSCSISLPSRGSFHLSLAVLYAIGHPGIFSLTRWSSQIHTGFHVPHATREKRKLVGINYWTFTIYGAGFSCFVFQHFIKKVFFPTTPIFGNWFRLVPFRSPLLRESRLLSSPPATKMFQFAGLLLTYL